MDEDIKITYKDGFVVDSRYFKRFLAKINFIFMLYQTDSKMIKHESFIWFLDHIVMPW